MVQVHGDVTMANLRISVLSLGVQLIVTASCMAADTPNFSGQWTLDASSSKLQVSPKSSTLVIRQQDQNMEVVTTSGSLKDTRSYKLDGVKRKIDARGLPMEVSAKLQGASLQTRAEAEGMTQLETWKLQDGGKSLSINRTVTGMVSVNELFVYRKR